MGVDYTAYSLIGVRINNPEIKTTVRGCTHPEVKNGKYCPECASPMWVTTECRHPLLETIDEKEIETTEPYFRVNENQMVIRSCSEDEVYVGFYCKSVNAHEAFKTPLINEQTVIDLRHKLKTALGDLYDDREFGFWTILDAG
jgi:hypothetical protein